MDSNASRARSGQRCQRTRAGLLWIGASALLLSGCEPMPAVEPAPRLEAVPAPSGSEPDDPRVQLGPRPFYLLDRLAPGPLRERLEACREGPFRPSRFSIGHRGAPLQFPEHTRESYLAAARMGAGAIECDVTFTEDRELVCRHSQCDLHKTTNILETPLAAACSEGFAPAVLDPATGEVARPARARCCTSDLTLAEFRELEGRMDAANPAAATVSEYLDATPAWRTDLYANAGTLMTHAESIALFRELDVDMTPELKAPMVEMPWAGEFSQRDYARALVDAYRAAGVPPDRVRLQSFDAEDIRFWLEIDPELGDRAVWLDERDPDEPAPTRAELEALARQGFRTLAPPISLLLRLDDEGQLRASEYATRARAAGLELIAWTAERSGRIRDGRVEGRDDDFYYGPLLSALREDGDLFRLIHALVEEAGVVAIFSDWPATTTYYASCMGLE